MSITKQREKLVQRLKAKDHRDAFVKAQIDVGIPFQIRALREKVPWTQRDLAEKAGMKQSWISKIENPAYSGFSLKTLLKLASVFDIGLVVRFVPISELVEWELKLSPTSLEVPSYEKDPYFSKSTTDIKTSVVLDSIKAQERADVIYIFGNKPSGSKIVDVAVGNQQHYGASFFQRQEKPRESAIS
jgi:transcriptional regulator with XRE-family HTH domain